MTKDEALKLALEALGLAKSSHNMVLTSDPPQSAWRYHNVDMKLREAITVIREALAQPDYRAMYLKVRDELAELQQRSEK